eukprot:gb/GFBE01039306.1/.p1 GENE.gb/GFBE01039306.1/~~gb/GFBE01039306.1/.p1  ORF type:complete len:286 (+),score=57.27 gb/GFBE01039306.1/:1-858(+)
MKKAATSRRVATAAVLLACGAARVVTHAFTLGGQAVLPNREFQASRSAAEPVRQLGLQSSATSSADALRSLHLAAALLGVSAAGALLQRGGRKNKTFAKVSIVGIPRSNITFWAQPEASVCPVPVLPAAERAEPAKVLPPVTAVAELDSAENAAAFVAPQSLPAARRPRVTRRAGAKARSTFAQGRRERRNVGAKLSRPAVGEGVHAPSFDASRVRAKIQVGMQGGCGSCHASGREKKTAPCSESASVVTSSLTRGIWRVSSKMYDINSKTEKKTQECKRFAPLH